MRIIAKTMKFLSIVTSFLPLKFEYANYIFPIFLLKQWKDVLFFYVQVVLALTLEDTLMRKLKMRS